MAFPTTTPEQRKERVDKLVEVLTEHPGLTLWRLARAMGASVGAAENSLMWAEELGILTYEDRQGNIFLLVNGA